MENPTACICLLIRAVAENATLGVFYQWGVLLIDGWTVQLKLCSLPQRMRHVPSIARAHWTIRIERLTMAF